MKIIFNELVLNENTLKKNENNFHKQETNFQNHRKEANFEQDFTTGAAHV